MEPDVTPVQTGWLDKLMSEAAKGDYWIQGSSYRGKCLPWPEGKCEAIGRDIISHINGNAMYHTGDLNFVKFMYEVANGKFMHWPFDLAPLMHMQQVRGRGHQNSPRLFVSYSVCRSVNGAWGLVENPSNMLGILSWRVLTTFPSEAGFEFCKSQAESLAEADSIESSDYLTCSYWCLLQQIHGLNNDQAGALYQRCTCNNMLERFGVVTRLAGTSFPIPETL